ncbi:MAG: UDP-N-acetylmuramoyl-L-alanine--D-glutamate ligase [Candidatus Binatia bacterium]
MTIRIADQRFLVVGAGKTGQSVAAFLVGRGGQVRLVERCAANVACAQLPAGIDVRIGDTARDLLRDIAAVIPSPGVPRSHVLLRRAVSRGIPVLSEIELGARFLHCPLLAVTGTNGKSTTTALLGAMLKEAGMHVFVGGNLGTPLIEACGVEPAFQAAVVEVSSFQLEWVYTFRPRVAVLLNLTADHLDRYAGMAEYGRAKAAMLAGQRPGDFAVLNRDDPWVWEQRRNIRAGAISFGREPVEFGSFVDGDTLIYWGPEPTARRFSLDGVSLQGAHNRENIMAATTAAAIWGVPTQAIQRALESARGLPHRLEFVRERAGVRFFDDSKGTNVGAVEKSVTSFTQGVILLAGGFDKRGDFAHLLPLLRTHVKYVVLFGAAGPRIQSQLDHVVPHSLVPDLAAAVREAAEQACAGDTVLLSPGCASFDEFSDYAARGRRFRELVEAL